MKIYSDHITESDVRNAFYIARMWGADIWIEGIRSFTPRSKYAYGVEVWAESHNGKRATGHVPAKATGPRDGYPRAASWDDWGYVIAYLYTIDPDARIGFYNDCADFIKKVRQAGPGRKSDLAFLDVLLTRDEK